MRSPRSARVIVALLAALSFPATGAGAATMRVFTADGTNEGFNDPTPVAPVGGNPGTSLGQQRLIVFQTAANIWGNILKSTVEIRVLATFDPLACGSGGAVLGSAGPTGVFASFNGAPFADTWYHSALANRLAGRDLDPTHNDIVAQFNSAIDEGCAGSESWYYGLDGNPGTDFDLLNVVLHELGHGLGFSSVTDVETGQFINGIPDVFARFTLDNETGLHWNEMTNAQRVTSATNTGHVVWDGPNVTGHAPEILVQAGVVRVDAPPSIAGPLTFGRASFGPPIASPGVTAAVALVQDGAAPTSDACSALVNGSAIVGKIALIDRGSCVFTAKVAAAQAAGAVGAIVINNLPGGVAPMPGIDPSITIPSLMISQADGNQIKAVLGAGVTMTLTGDPSRLAGTDPAGRVLLYAPDPLVEGSSISHWDDSPTPDLLMEPSYTGDILSGLDLTPYQLEDIGWGVEVGIPPAAAALGNAFPNPFGPSSIVAFTIITPGEVDVSIYDLNGRLVKQVLHEVRAAGPGQATWDGTDQDGRRMRQGVYLCKLQLGDFKEARRMVLVK